MDRSVNRSIAGFDFQDFLTRIVPGVVVITPALSGILISGVKMPSIGISDSLLVLAIVGLLFGELIDIFRSAIFPVPTPFKQVIYGSIDDPEVLSFWDRLYIRASDLLRPIHRYIPDRILSYFSEETLGRVTVFDPSDRSFRDELETQFEVELNSLSVYAIYSMFLSYMEPRMGRVTRRHQLVRIFSQNLMIASFLAAIHLAWIISINLESPLHVVVGIILLFILMIVWEFALFLSSVAYSFVDLLIIDYYIDRVTN